MKRILVASTIVISLAGCATKSDTIVPSLQDDLIACGVALLSTGSFSVNALLVAAQANAACMRLPGDALNSLVNKSATETARKRGVRMVP